MPGHEWKPYRLLTGVVKLVTRLEFAIAAVTLTLILVLVFLQAAQRYLPFQGFAWTGELARFSLVWTTFAVAGVLVTEHGHIALEIVDTIASGRMLQTVQVFSLLVVACVGAALTYEAWHLIQTQGIVKSAAMRMPMSWIYIPVLIGVASTCVRALVVAIQIGIRGPIQPVADDNVEDPTL